MVFSLMGLVMFLMLFAGIVVFAGLGISKFSGRQSLDGERLDRLREVMDRLADTEARLEDLADTDTRLAELEERADFAERVLTDMRDHKQISPGEQ